jgi:outer membrane immunogenic protein
MSLLLGAAFSLAASGFAFAADMLVKAPPAPAPIPYDWTGFYVGGNIGAALSRNGQSEGQAFADPNTTGSPLLSFDTNGTAAIGGLEIGHNWQFAQQWVAGIEADFSWTDLGGSQTYNPIPPGMAVAVAPSFLMMSRNVEWVSSARGRFGYAWDRTLLYLTGGAAWSRTDFAGINSRAGGAFGESISFHSTRDGWVIGGGLEYLVSNNWSARAQYLYYSFRGMNGIASGTSSGIDTFSWGGPQIISVTAGLNYKVGYR